MKKKNLLLLTILALTLSGCGDTSNSKSTSSKASDAPISTKNDDKTSTNSNSTKKDDTTKKDTTGTTDTTDTTSDEYATSLWPSDVKDLMLANLGSIIPYIDLEIKKPTATWDSSSSTLTVLGGIDKGVSEAQLQAAKKTYEDKNWKASVKDGKMTATDPTDFITVEYFDDGGLPTLNAIYGEVFNPTKASSWPTDLISDMNFCMRNHGADIPYVYLGTVNPTGSWSSGKYTISGGTYNAQVLDLAESAFKNANSSITGNDSTAPTWTYSKNKASFTASIVLSDGTSLAVNISKTNGNKLATMTITCLEEFSVPASGSWSNDIISVFTKDFDGHSIPWFYTGGTPDMKHNDGDTTLTITGAPKSWNDQILTLAKTACETENTSIDTEANKWTFKESKDGTLTCSRTYTDDSKLEFTVSHYSSTTESYAKIDVNYHPAFNATETGSWPTEVTSVFTKDFDGHSIPWFYIGGGKTKVSSHTDGDNTLEFYGASNTWNDSIIELAKAACDKDTENEGDDYKWTYSVDEDNILTCNRKFSDGCKIKFTVENDTPSTNKAKIVVTYTEKFKAPSKGNWPDSIQSLFYSYDNHSIPWFYLGGTPTLDSSEDDGTATIFAPNETWDDQILDLAESACKKETQNETNEDYKWKCERTTSYESDMMTCTRTFDDGCVLKFTVEKHLAETNKAVMKIYFTEKFEAPTSGEWPEELVDAFGDDEDECYWCVNENVHSIPWFYMGGDVSCDYDYTAGITNVTADEANTWNDQILTLAMNAVEKENTDKKYDDDHKWKYSTPTTEFSASKLFDDGCTIQFTVKSQNSRAVMTVTYIPAFNYPTGDDAAWSKTISDAITNLVGSTETIPWIYLGSDYIKSYPRDDGLYLEGSYWNDMILTKAKEELDKYTSSGWTYTTSDTGITRLTATKTTSNNKTITLELDKTNYNLTTLDISVK